MSLADRKEREKEQRRRDIIDAAEKLFLTNKYEDVSMDDIARAVELSRPTIYLYFKNKESILFAVLLRGINKLNGMFKEGVSRAETGIDKIAATGAAFVEFYAEQPDMYRLLRYAWSQRFETSEIDNAKEVMDASTELIVIMCKAIEQGMEDGTIMKGLNPLDTAIFLVSASENAIEISPYTKKLLAYHGVSEEEHLRHTMRLVGNAIVAR